MLLAGLLLICRNLLEADLRLTLRLLVLDAGLAHLLHLHLGLLTALDRRPNLSLRRLHRDLRPCLLDLDLRLLLRWCNCNMWLRHLHANLWLGHLH